MSFITKRERVFNEYNLFELPSRNEGKLKAYASCTDARAWSHFCSDKTEHLVEIIKRNNEKCRPKYVPTEVIVNTLMLAKNCQISCLKRKIEEFEQLLAAYNELDLTPSQKNDIANAHASIKAANKELDELCLDLDLSGYTEGIDSEGFETGKSRGDQASRSAVETAKSTWSYTKEPMQGKCKGECCDVSTSINDSRIDEMRDMIVSKDAKLNAMQNTIAVLENDVCEPYCIYAQINTALEKIFGILRQNLKYRQYLDLLTVGESMHHIHLKIKILYKIKILEKFSLALIAPCNPDSKPQDCTCYHAEVVTNIETTYAFTSTENCRSILDNKRANLVADIIDIEEMKDILSKDGTYKTESEDLIASSDIDECNISKENINRLKKLQSNYDDLMTCYENLKSEKDHLYIRCQKLSNIEDECERLRNDLKEYNHLWNEKEYFRKRSDNLDELKETYYMLLDETSNLESKFKAESEISKAKSDTINELRNKNVLLEKTLNETSLLFEKEKNAIMFKLKESECSIMCKEQQIKSLSSEIEKLLQQNENITSNVLPSLELLDEIAIQKEQIINLRETCKCHEDEQIYFQQEFNRQLELINVLKFEVESWKSKYEDIVKTHEVLNTQIKVLNDENQDLSRKIVEKREAVNNLHNIIQNKSGQIHILTEELEKKNKSNNELLVEVNKMHSDFKKKLFLLENEAQIKINNYDEKSNDEDIKHRNNNENIFDSNEKGCLSNASSVHEDILSQIKCMCQESAETIAKYDNIKEKYRNSLQITKKESAVLENELLHLKEETSAIENLHDIIQSKSNEIKNLTEELEQKDNENKELLIEINKIRNDFKKKLILLENEDKITTNNCDEKLKDAADIQNRSRISNDNIIDSNENKCLSNYSIVREDILSEIILLRQESAETIDKYNDITEKFRNSLQLTQKENADFEKKILYLNELTQHSEELKCANKKLFKEKEVLENDLQAATNALNILNEDFEQTHNRLQELEPYKEKYEILLTTTEEKIYNEEKELNKLQQKNTDLELEMESLVTKCQLIDGLNIKLHAIKVECDELMAEKNNFKIKLDEKTKELNSLVKQLEICNKENSDLLSQIKTLEFYVNSSKNDINSLIGENLSIRSRLDDLSKEESEKNSKLIYYKNIETQYNDLMIDNVQLKESHQKLHEDFSINKEILKRLENEIEELKIQNQNILSEKETLEILLEKKQQEVISANSTQSFYDDIKEEIDNMKKEKLNSNETIIDLMNKLQHSERHILNLNDDIFKRNNTISELQNHINDLQEEIKELHKNLEIAIENSEVISKESFEKIDESVKNVEAHYSKATHNMKVELAKMKEKNNVRKNKTPTTRLTSVETDIEKHKYISQLTHLQNEREKIILNLNQLETKTLGYSILMINSTAEDIIEVLNNIRKVFDDKNDYYEQKLLNSQNSYQLLKSKVEEAEKIVELEKQKIINEKEISKQDRINTESQLLDLHKQLKAQEIQYTEIIEDLEAKMLTQKLMFDQINESKEGHLNKLKEETIKLKEIYENSLADIQVLQQKVQDSEHEKKIQSDQINKLTTDYKEKNTEIKTLQKLIEDISNKVTSDIQLQTECIVSTSNRSTQTNENDIKQKYLSENSTFKEINPNILDLSTYNVNTNKGNNNLNSSDLCENNVPTVHKQFQILTAKLDPSFDFVKNIYQNVKKGRLQTRALEKYSVSSVIDINNDNLQDLNNNVSQKSIEFRSIKSDKYSDKLRGNSVVDTLKPDNVTFLRNKNNNNDKIQSSSDKIPHLDLNSDLAVTKENSFINPLRNKYKNSIEEQHQAVSSNSNKLDTFIIQSSENKHDDKANTFQPEFPISTEVSHIDKKEDGKNIINNTNTLNTITKVPAVQAYALSIEVSSISDVKSQESLNIYMSPKSIDYSVTNLSTKNTNQNIPLIQRSIDNTETQSIDPSRNKYKKSNEEQHQDVSLSSNKLNLSTLQSSGNKHDDKNNTFQPEFSISSLVSHIDEKEDVQNIIDSIKHNTIIKQPTVQAYASSIEVSSVSDIKSQETLNIYMSPRSIDYSVTNVSTKDTSQNIPILQKPININPEIQYTSKDKIYEEPKTIHELSSYYLPYIQDNKSNLKAKKLFTKDDVSLSNDSLSEFPMKKMYDSIKKENSIDNKKDKNDLNACLPKKNIINTFRKNDLSGSQSCEQMLSLKSSSSVKESVLIITSTELESHKKFINKSVLVKLDTIDSYEKKIKDLSRIIEATENEYKKKIEAVKRQYENHVKSIINKHDQGVITIQNLHEETLSDIIKIHDTEIENLRTMSIDAMTKVEKLQKENKNLKSKLDTHKLIGLDQRPIKLATSEPPKRKFKSRTSTSFLTKTDVEAFNVKPKGKLSGPCTCSLDINISDTIRNIFEQVDVGQRKLAEQTYLKYIANKLIDDIETLNARELSFLHLKVCRIWKTKLSKEEALKWKIDALESELMNKQLQTQRHTLPVSELDRKVTKERRRLREVRKAICRNSPGESNDSSPRQFLSSGTGTVKY